MKVAIIDDELLARQHVRDCLKSHNHVNIVAECPDGFSGIKAIQEFKPDLIFLDIQMPRINGFEMLELLEEMPKVIFTTAFDEFALKAFEANAVDYLLKPFGQERFDKAMARVLSNEAKSATVLNETAGKSTEESRRIILKHNGEIRIIPAESITYIEAWDDYVKLHTAENTFVKKKTLSFYENSLNKNQFVRCHRSYLVNIASITAMDHSGGDTWEIRLKDGFHLPVSRQGYGRLKEVLGL